MFKGYVGLLIIISCALWVPIISDEVLDNQPKKEDFCRKPGKVCDDCNTVRYCVETDTGDWLKYHLYNCDTGYTCSDSVRDCTIEPNPKCDSEILGYQFICNQVGVFPDPFDCTKYHMCVKKDADDLLPYPTPSTVQCGNGYSYDPMTVSCRNHFTGTCESRLPSCDKTFVGKLPSHPNMYYICFMNAADGKYFPQIFACPFDQVFNGKHCEAELPPPSGLDEEGVCVGDGFFYHPESCAAYWYCSAAGTLPVKEECEEGRRFDAKSSLCIDFEC